MYRSYHRWPTDEHDRTRVSLRRNAHTEFPSVTASTSNIVRYTSTDTRGTTACTRISCPMTNRASAKREPLIHQHQAGTRAVLRPVGIPHGEPHYIPVVVDVTRHPRGPRGPWSRDTDQIVVISGDCERKRFIGDLWTRRGAFAPEWSYFIRRSFFFRPLIDTPYRTSISLQLGPESILRYYY